MISGQFTGLERFKKILSLDIRQVRSMIGDIHCNAIVDAREKWIRAREPRLCSGERQLPWKVAKPSGRTELGCRSAVECASHLPPDQGSKPAPVHQPRSCQWAILEHRSGATESPHQATHKWSISGT